ncbi:MAG: acyl-CoA/acyl-ACP dehydrogenase, partial [Planctomycetaceae bacterium]|nr:acyl-CoA/acyl-ACP dehydrogenase [Planctomycetaceae bacterium]
MSEFSSQFNRPARFIEDFERLLTTLSEASQDVDSEQQWPAAAWEALKQAGVLSWNVPLEFGGADLNSVEMTYGYIRLAEACLTTTFVLTQFN